MKATWSTELPQIGLIALMALLAAVTWPWALLPGRAAATVACPGLTAKTAKHPAGHFLSPGADF